MGVGSTEERLRKVKDGPIITIVGALKKVSHLHAHQTDCYHSCICLNYDLLFFKLKLKKNTIFFMWVLEF